MSIAFVRHGETAANRHGVLLGRADPPLTGVGRAQVARLAAVLATRRPVVVLSSPLGRCRATAAAVAEACDLDVVVDDRLVELDYGEWDLSTFDDVPREELAAWRADPTFRPPGGESLADVAARVGSLCEELLAGEGPAKEATVVAVSHVSPIKAGVAWAIDANPLVSWRLRLDVASITSVGGTAAAPLLLAFNETGHLDPAADS